MGRDGLNGVARIFVWGGHPVHFPSSLREPTAFSGGGGVVAENFRDLDYRITFSGGVFYQRVKKKIRKM